MDNLQRALTILSECQEGLRAAPLGMSFGEAWPSPEWMIELIGKLRMHPSTAEVVTAFDVELLERALQVLRANLRASSPSSTTWREFTTYLKMFEQQILSGSSSSPWSRDENRSGGWGGGSGRTMGDNLGGWRTSDPGSSAGMMGGTSSTAGTSQTNQDDGLESDSGGEAGGGDEWESRVTDASNPLRDEESEMETVSLVPKESIGHLVWYATNRRPRDPADPSAGFLGDRDETVHYGSCEVFIPKSHTIGSTGSSWLWRTLTGVDDRLKLRVIRPSAADAFWQQVGERLSGTEDKHALVFIHGYNVDFREAALRAAQISADLNTGAPMAFFSWPSKGRLGAYAADAAAIEASQDAIAEFLSDFASRSGAKTVHVIAHSMGNRGIINALRRIKERAQTSAGLRFGQVILAAADVDAQVFRQNCAVFGTLAKRTTLYVAGSDLALRLSKWLADYPRAGFLPPLMVVPGIDTVNVTHVDLTRFGHGYIAETAAVLSDMYELIKRDTPPAHRYRLAPGPADAGEPHWMLKA